ncbi:sortase, partial [Clavibacter nebraskensis]
ARLLALGALVVGVVAVMLLTIGMRRPQQGGRR